MRMYSTSCSRGKSKVKYIQRRLLSLVRPHVTCISNGTTTGSSCKWHPSCRPIYHPTVVPRGDHISSSHMSTCHTTADQVSLCLTCNRSCSWTSKPRSIAMLLRIKRYNRRLVHRRTVRLSFISKKGVSCLYLPC